MSAGMTIIVAAADRERFRAALTLATAQAALGGDVTLYCHEASVAMLRDAPRSDDASDALKTIGLPDRSALISLARESGVRMIACQTGMAAHGLTLDDLAPGVEGGGMVAILAALGDARLVVV